MPLETNLKHDSLFDPQFQQNQTVCLVNMRSEISKIAHLQEFLRNSTSKLSWCNVTTSSYMEKQPDSKHNQLKNDDEKFKNIGNIEHCSNDQLFLKNWSSIWHKLSTRLKKLPSKEKLKKYDNTNLHTLSTGKYETLAIQFIQYCFNGQFEKVKHLLQIENQIGKNQFCVDPNIADSHGQFGLLGAVLTWNMKLVNLLLDFGANINQLTDDGLTVFTICLLKYYELFDQITRINKYAEDEQSERSSQGRNDGDHREHQHPRQHILPIITKSPRNDDDAPDIDVNENVGDNNEKTSNTVVKRSSLPTGRNYVYRVELPILLSTTTSESLLSLRRAARLSQIRRMHLNKIRARRLIMTKSDEMRKPMQTMKTVEQSLQGKEDLTNIDQQKFPTFQRFTNCLTRFHTEADFKLNLAKEVTSFGISLSNSHLDNTKFSRSNSSKSKYIPGRRSRPQTLSLDRRKKQALIDVASKDVLINQPYRVISPLIRETAAHELAKNPYFLASHSINTSNADDQSNEKIKTSTPDNEKIIEDSVLLAKQKQMMNIIDLLLKRGANPNTGIRPLPALFLAVQAGDPDMVRKLIHHGADTNICLRVDNPLNSENVISQGICIDEDETPLVPSLDGLTVLHYAVLVPDEMGVKLTEILLKDGMADPNKQASLDDSFKLKSQFTRGIQSGNSSEMNSGKSTPDEKKVNEGRTPLHLVCSREYDLIVNYWCFKIFM
ncbi:unnamed protein product [Heterobilharzia americana]|nr:unnamed protein product [Heterobilharzia americana]